MDALCPTCSRPNPANAAACAHCSTPFAGSAPMADASWGEAPRGGGAVPLGDPRAYEPAPADPYAHGAVPAYAGGSRGPERPGGVTFAAVMLFIYAGVLTLYAIVVLVILTVVSAAVGLGPTEFFTAALVGFGIAVGCIAVGVGLVKGRPWGQVGGIGLHGLALLLTTVGAAGVMDVMLLFPGLVVIVPSVLALVFLLNAPARRWFAAPAAT